MPSGELYSHDPKLLEHGPESSNKSSISGLIEQKEEAFSPTASLVLSTFKSFIETVRAGNWINLRSFYSRRFSGHFLGLNHLKLESARDGVRIYRFSTDPDVVCKRDKAVTEWSSYAAAFMESEEIAVRLHHLEVSEPQRSLIATISFVHIGWPFGAERAGIDRASFRIVWERSGGSLRILNQALIEGKRILADQPQFMDVASDAGIDFQNQCHPEFLGQSPKFGMVRYGTGGITAVDYDNNGLCDLFIADGVESKLFCNCGDGTFEDVTSQAGLAGLDGVTAAVFADYDNDGYKDLFVCRAFHPNQLFRNNGDGTFTDVTSQAGLGDDCGATVAAWADYNNDGYLDLYVGRYFDPRDAGHSALDARKGAANQLYRNNQNGTFTNVTEQAGVGDKGLCLGVAWHHAGDNDYPDLLVVNDFGQNTYYRNNGDGRFEEGAITADMNSMSRLRGAVTADFDNDGWEDLYVANGWTCDGGANGIDLDLPNSGVDGEKAYDTGIYLHVGFGSYSGHGRQRNRHLRRNGAGTFQEIGRAAGTDLALHSRAVAVADFWNRGVLDIAVAASSDRHALLKNIGEYDRNWLQVELIGTVSNRDAVGAQIVLHISGTQQSRQQVSGDGFGIQGLPRIHFGLDQHDSVDKLVVRWPRSGLTQTFRDLKANRILQITEGETHAVEKHYLSARTPSQEQRGSRKSFLRDCLLSEG